MQPRTLLTLLSMLVMWLCYSTAWGNSSVVLPKGSFDYAISPYISIFEDDTKALTIDDIVSLKYQVFFRPSHAESLKLGISDSNFWFRFSITNPYDEPMESVFTLSDSDFDIVNIYRLRAESGKYIEITQQDPLRSLPGGMVQFFTLRIVVPPNTTHTYMLQLHSIGLLTTHVALMSLDRFISNEQVYFLIFGLITGLCAMAAWGFLYVWLTFRIRIAFYGGLLCIASVIYMTSNLGVLRLFSGIGGFSADKIAEMSLGAIYLFHLLAATSLTWRGRYKVLIHRSLYTIAILAFPLAIFIVVFFSQAAMPTIASVLVVSSYVAALTLSIATSTTPTSQRWIMLGYWFSATCVFAMVLTSYNLLSFNSLSIWGEMFIPFAIILTLITATIYQLPSYRIAQHATPLNGLEGGILMQAGQEMLTPINSLIGINRLLSDTPLSPHQRELNSTLKQAGLELLHSAQQITDLGLLQERLFELNIEPVSITTLLNNVMQSLHPEASRKKIELILHTQDLPELIQIDAKRLYTVLFNLLSQAIIHSDHGDIVLKAFPYGSQNIEGLRLQLQISNIMVRPEILRASFATMQDYSHSLQGRPSRHQWQLNLTRLLLKKMHAKLEVESMTARGASIGLALPLAQSIPYQESSKPKHFERISNRSILIVDDSTSLRSMLETQIKRWGLKVHGTYSAKEALARLRTHSNLGTAFDFIIIDHDLPFLDAIQLAKRINEDTDIIHKPIMLMLSNQSTGAIKKDAYQAGIRSILTKPINTEHLLQALLELAATLQEDSL